MELGLRRRKRRRRTPHDGCIWLVLASLGDRRCAGTRNRPTGLSAGEDWSLERVCSRARRAPETETRHCPETGRHRCRSRSAALWSRRSDRDHHSQELVPRRERGPSPRGKSSVATRSQRPRGERPFLQGESSRKGEIALGKRTREKATFKRRATAAKSWDRPGAGRPFPSRKRGPEGKTLGCRTVEGTSGRESRRRFTRRRRKRSWQPSTGREKGVRTLRLESREVTGVSEARSS